MKGTDKSNQNLEPVHNLLSIILRNARAMNWRLVLSFRSQFYQLAHECRGLVHDSVMDCTLLKFE